MYSLEWYRKIKKDRIIWGVLRRIEGALGASNIDLPIFYKLRIAEFVIRLRKSFHKKFGLFIIFGWSKRWNEYADIVDSSQDIFHKHHIRIFRFGQRSIQDLNDQRFISSHIRKLINFDGAILINKSGQIVDSGVYIEGLKPRAMARVVNPRAAGDLSNRFGFKKKVHARHISAITASHIFKNTTVYTLSEETGDFHIFEGGKIVYSTVRGEVSSEN